MSDDSPLVTTTTTPTGTELDPRATATNIAKRMSQKHGEGGSDEGQDPIEPPSPTLDQRGHRKETQPKDPEESQDPDQQDLLDQDDDPQVLETEGMEPELEIDDAITDELYEELQSYGLDLGVPPSQVQPDLLPAYNQMAQSAIALATEARNRELEAQEVRMQVEDFMRRVEENPKDILTLLALNKPDQFNEAIEIFQRIQEDSRERELLERELEVRARQAAMQRQQQAQQQGAAQREAARVRAQLTRACQRFGVDPNIAARYITAEIKQDGNITNQRIEEIVRHLRPTKLQSPSKQQKAKQVPNQPVGGQSPPSNETPGSGGNRRDGLEYKEPSPIRATVKGLLRKYNT